MKINPNNYREIVLNILLHNDNNNNRLYESIDYIFNKLDLKQDHKNKAIYIVQGITRNRSSIDLILEQLIKKYYKSIPIEIKIILRMGVFQINNMNSPDYASVSSSVSIAKKYNFKFYKLVNAVLRKSIDYNPQNNTNSLDYESKLLNHPQWLISKWMSDYDDKYVQNISKWNNMIPETWFRINKICYSKKTFIDRLDHFNIKFQQYKYDDNYFSTNNTSKLLNSNLFKNGNITVQNPFSGFICKMLEPGMGDEIIDACASPGGKTAYISELMNNSGKIFSYDINEKRLLLLKKTIDRMKLLNVVPSIINASNSKLPFVNKILLDVPCSGTGVLNKYPDIKWRKTFNDIKEMVSIQKEILLNASKYLYNGGILVYSTCSLEKEENQEIIKWFLRKNNKFTIKKITNIIPDKFISKDGFFITNPSEHKIDGGFAVVLINNAN